MDVEAADQAYTLVRLADLSRSAITANRFIQYSVPLNYDCHRFSKDLSIFVCVSHQLHTFCSAARGNRRDIHGWRSSLIGLQHQCHFMCHAPSKCSKCCPTGWQQCHPSAIISNAWRAIASESGKRRAIGNVLIERRKEVNDPRQAPRQ